MGHRGRSERQIVAGPLSPAIASRLAQLRATPATSATLRAGVTAHLAHARRVAAADPFVDIARAEQVAAACLALLDAWPTLDDDARSWVAAACLYFADSDDDEDDFASILGFDDDAEVVNHVAARLGLDVHIAL